MRAELWPIAFFLVLMASSNFAAPGSVDRRQNQSLSSAYLSLFDRSLGLSAGQKEKVKLHLEAVGPALEEVTSRLSSLRSRSIALRLAKVDGIYGVLDYKQREALRSRRIRRKELGEGQKESMDAIGKGMAAETVKLREDLRILQKRRDALLEELYGRLYPLLDADQREKFEQTKLAVKQRDSAEAIYPYLAQMADIQLPDPELRAQQERLRKIERARRNLIRPWVESWKKKDFKSFAELAGPGFKSSSWSEFVLLGKDAVAEEYRLSPSPLLDRNRAVASMERFFKPYADVRDVEITLFGAETEGEAEIFHGHISVRGSTDQGRRVESAASVRLRVEPTGDAERLTGIELFGGRRHIASGEPAFEDWTERTGLAQIPPELRWESIRRGGYTLALDDYDKDGWVDLYVGTARGGGALLRNEHGRFQDWTSRSGLRREGLVKSAVFGDFNNDGATDLLLARFDHEPEKQLLLYKGVGDGRFEMVRNFNFLRFAKNAYNLPMPVAVGDFNGDQKLDIYVGCPGKMDFTTLEMEKTPERLGRLPVFPHAFLVNRGGWVFEDATREALGHTAGSQYLAPHSAVAVDYDLDGKTDIVVLDDRANPSPIFRNKGGGRFEEVSEKAGVRVARWGMGPAVGDFDNDGFPDLFMTNVNFAAQFAQADLTGWLYGRETKDHTTPGNRLYRNRGNGTFEDVTDRAGLRFVGEAAGGAEFVDFDNDGDLDLYVVNGLWTGPHKEDLAHTFVLAGSHEKWIFRVMRLLQLDPAPIWNSTVDPNNGSQSILTLLGHHFGEDGRPAFSMGGSQRNRLYRNDGDGTFTDISYVAGVDALADGYVVATADVDRDGSVDLILRNGDPGTPDRLFRPLQLFRNYVGSRGRHLRVRLAGVRSNTDAIGAKVRLVDGRGGKQYRELLGNNGAAQSERVVHFGLGGESRVSRLEILWPSGQAQSFADVEAGDYALKEGGGLERDSKLAYSLQSSP